MLNINEERFDRLEALIEKGFAAVAQDIADTRAQLRAEIADTRGELKADIATVMSDVHEVRAELSDIRKRFDALETLVQNTSGFAKEIDHLLQRVGAIEKHLGIRQAA